MKKVIIFLMFILVLVSCDDQSNRTKENNDFYYVEYEIIVAGGWTPKLEITINTENGSKILNQAPLKENIPISIIVGPVAKGFYASAEVETRSYQVSLSLKVSKNNGPFALKAYDSSSSKDVLSANYTIDF